MYIQTIPKRTLSEPGLTSPVLVLTLTKTQKRPQKLWTGGANPASPSFFRRISNTFRWLLECTSLKKVGLQAGRYSGNNRPDLNRTPQALHRVFAPSGPGPPLRGLLDETMAAPPRLLRSTTTAGNRFLPHPLLHRLNRRSQNRVGRLSRRRGGGRSGRRIRQGNAVQRPHPEPGSRPLASRLGLNRSLETRLRLVLNSRRFRPLGNGNGLLRHFFRRGPVESNSRRSRPRNSTAIRGPPNHPPENQKTLVRPSSRPRSQFSFS